MRSLRDYLDSNLELLSIGLNPSPTAVRTGVYFAHPRNRFWPAAKVSGLVPASVPVSTAGLARLLADERIGFTDIVKRPTAGGGDLGASDYRHGAPVLLKKIIKWQPAIAWFHGRLAYRNFLRYVFADKQAGDWGLQAFHIGSTRIFVSPNPSPANAAYSLSVLADYYRQLQGLRQQLRQR